MMTGEIVYAVVDEYDHRQGGWQNTFKLFETKVGARRVLNASKKRRPSGTFRIIKVHLEEVDTVETTESS